jgi:hypothetical protein
MMPRSLPRLPLFIFSTLTLVGCLGGTDTQESLRVTSTVPQQGEITASSTQSLRLQFDQSPAPEADLRLFTLTKFNTSQTIPGTSQLEGDQFIFTPSQPLQPGTRYTARLEPGWVSSSDHSISMSQRFILDFSTRAIESTDGLRAIRVEPTDLTAQRTVVRLGGVNPGDTIAVIPYFGSQSGANTSTVPSVTLTSTGTVPLLNALDPALDRNSLEAGSTGLQRAAESLNPFNINSSQDVASNDLEDLLQHLSISKLRASAIHAHHQRLELLSQGSQRIQELASHSIELSRFLDRTLDGQPRYVRNQWDSGFHLFGGCRGPYVVNSTQCNFTVLDYDDHEVQITTTLAFESQDALWFIQEDRLHELTLSDLQRLASFVTERAIPSNQRYFGSLPDSDGNHKIIIVFTDKLIEPGAAHGVLGYVAPWDLLPNDALRMSYTSNEGDIFYASLPSSVATLSYTKPQYLDTVMPETMVHELKHLIAVSARLSRGLTMEKPWIEEPSAVASEELVGLGTHSGATQRQARYALSRPENYRIRYETTPRAIENRLSIYGFNFLFLWKASEAVGHETFWRSLVQSTASDTGTVEGAARSSMSDMMTRFAMSLLLSGDQRFEDFQLSGLNLRDGSWRRLGTHPLQASQSITVNSVGYFLGQAASSEVEIEVGVSPNSPASALVVKIPGTLASWPQP